ncbi:MAG: hypothetical protein QNK37_08700, partial [Acidobacteriota bacterium]|nr:hypothetical protein [Acidobacteriota bacterium]
NRCHHRFQIDLETGRNCRKIKGPDSRVDARHMLFDPNSRRWQVQTGGCKGFLYNLAGVVTLVRTGLVTPMTPIKPPGSAFSYKAGDLAQLHPYFEEKKKETQRVEEAQAARQVPPPASAEDDDLDRSWYEMDCGEFFARKLKPVLSKDLFTKAG